MDDTLLSDSVSEVRGWLNFAFCPSISSLHHLMSFAGDIPKASPCWAPRRAGSSDDEPIYVGPWAQMGQSTINAHHFQSGQARRLVLHLPRGQALVLVLHLPRGQALVLVLHLQRGQVLVLVLHLRGQLYILVRTLYLNLDLKAGVSWPQVILSSW